MMRTSVTPMRSLPTIVPMLALLLLPGLARAAECPSAAPVLQQETLEGGVLVRAAGGGKVSPYLEMLDASCHRLLRIGTSLSLRSRHAAMVDPDTKLRFRVLKLAGLPQPLVLVAVASPGGSDVSFDTQLVGRVGGHYRPLIEKPVQSLLEGGVYVGPLGPKLGDGVAVWNFVWANGEAHVSPHRYTLRRQRWTGSRFTDLPALTTKGKYTDPVAALAELHVDYKDAMREMPGFDQLR